MANIDFGGTMEEVVTSEEFTLQRAREVLENETVAVLGYGVQGPGQALNMRDNGIAVIVGQREPLEKMLIALLCNGHVLLEGAPAWLDRDEALHPFDGHVVLVESHKEDRPFGRDLETSRAIRLDGHDPVLNFQAEVRAVRHDRVLLVVGVAAQRHRQVQDRPAVAATPLDEVVVAAAVLLDDGEVAVGAILHELF